MFAVGDKVVYPLHGGAIVQEIQHRECEGAGADYYILQMLFEHMTVAIPVASSEQLGLRAIGNEEVLSKLEEVLHEVPDVQAYKSISWNRRFQLYMDKIKTGDMVEVGRIFKILSVLESNRKISVGERRLLHNTRQILQSEIMLIRKVEANEAVDWLQKCIE